MTHHPPRALGARALAVLCIGLLVAASASTGADAADAVAPANTKALTKCKEAGCVQCVKSGKSSTSCTACSKGPVDAVLEAGRCVCPAGSGLTGSKNIANVAKMSSTKAKVATCSPCAVDAYSAASKPVSAAKCTTCPVGSGTLGQVGSPTCYVPGGFYFDSATGTVKVCPANRWCPGGDFQTIGRTVNICPIGSSSPQQSDEFADCTVPPGSFYDPKTATVSKCPIGSWCPGGSVENDGQLVQSCPKDSTTSTVGASQFAQCVVQPGTFFDGTDVLPCPPDSFCPGGGVTGAGSKPFECPQGPPPTTFPATGATTQNDCIVPKGFFWDGSKVVQCPVNKWCPGGSIGSTGTVVNDCILGTTSIAQYDELADCQVPPGKYYDGSKVVTCPANKWCAGGSVTSAGTIANDCDANTSSPAGSDAKADCVLDKGYFCVYNGDLCTVTQCTADSYCQGGNSIIASPPGITPCPQAPNTFSAVGSTQLSDCKVKPSYYCASYSGTVCTSVVICPVNKWCPGGLAVTDSASGLKSCPTNTQSLLGSDAKADCTLNPGYYCVYDVADVCTVTICPANNTCAGGNSIESPATPGGPDPCYPGGVSNPGSTKCGCNAPTNFCIAGSTCTSVSGNYQCICTSTNLAVVTESAGTCGTAVTGPGSQAKTYTVTPGVPLLLTYDSQVKPNRYLILEGNQCGKVIRDTGFTGVPLLGCAASAPCCTIGPGCTGGLTCGAFPGAIPAPGGGGATGTTTPVISTVSQVTVVSLSVCTGAPTDNYQNTLFCSA